MREEIKESREEEEFKKIKQLLLMSPANLYRLQFRKPLQHKN
jgi:hypothetical protein